jgi:cytidylate kinase
MKKHIITIAGRPGSGKSTAAKRVAENLKFHHFSSGDLFRMLAGDLGIDILQANLTAEQNVELDYLVDERLREIGEKEDEQVIDSRMAWHWMPFSFKVFLDLDLEVAASRIIDGMTEERLTSERIPRDPNEYMVLLNERLNSEARRYKALYDVNPYDIDNYDLVVDTEPNSAAQTTQLILGAYHKWLEEDG